MEYNEEKELNFDTEYSFGFIMYSLVMSFLYYIFLVFFIGWAMSVLTTFFASTFDLSGLFYGHISTGMFHYYFIEIFGTTSMGIIYYYMQFWDGDNKSVCKFDPIFCILFGKMSVRREETDTISFPRFCCTTEMRTFSAFSCISALVQIMCALLLIVYVIPYFYFEGFYTIILFFGLYLLNLVIYDTFCAEYEDIFGYYILTTWLVYIVNKFFHRKKTSKFFSSMLDTKNYSQCIQSEVSGLFYFFCNIIIICLTARIIGIPYIGMIGIFLLSIVIIQYNLFCICSTTYKDTVRGKLGCMQY